MSKQNQNILKFAKKTVADNFWYATYNSKFKIVKVLYYLSAVYLLFTEAVLLGFYTMKLDNLLSVNASASIITQFRNSAYFVAGALVLLVASCVLLKLKCNLIFAVLSVANCTYSFVGLLKRSLENYLQYGLWRFWTKYGIIIILLAVLSIFVFIARLYERKHIKEEYDGLVAAIFNKHSDEGEDNISATDFEKYLNEYEGEDVFVNYPHLKRSVRKRREKQEIIANRKEELERIRNTEE